MDALIEGGELGWKTYSKIIMEDSKNVISPIVRATTIVVAKIGSILVVARRDAVIGGL